MGWVIPTKNLIVSPRVLFHIACNDFLMNFENEVRIVRLCEFAAMNSHRFRLVFVAPHEIVRGLAF
jgi:hypothetical protein